MSHASLAADVREREARQAVGADLDAGHVAARAGEELVVVEVEDVAVGVDAARPADLERVEVALVAAVEGRRELARLDLDREARLARHRLDDLPEALVLRARLEEQLHRD